MTDPTKQDRAWLALADGSVFEGRPFGARGVTIGEAVFTTTWTGYQEVLTDPSYYGQIVTMTAPEIGNVGVNADDSEAVSGAPSVAGFVVRDASPITSNWRAEESLDAYL
ncbi:MAG TPA: carbamoyl-phosphate synthase domain-containing protein, partial [Polyangiaceae bacterium]